MVPKVDKEWRQRGGVGYLVVACKFRQKQIVHPIILQLGDIRPQVLFHHYVHPFGFVTPLRKHGKRYLVSYIVRAHETLLKPLKGESRV